MKIKKIFLLAISISAGLLLLSNPVDVFASSGQQMNSRGSISFIFDDKYPITDSGTEGNSNNEKNTSTTKPVGQLPNTGEVVKKSLALSGATLILIGLFLFINKRKKQSKLE